MMELWVTFRINVKIGEVKQKSYFTVKSVECPNFLLCAFDSLLPIAASV